MRSERLDGIADALLVGERPIARRLDDSVVRVGALGADDPAPRRAASRRVPWPHSPRAGRSSRSAPISRTPSRSSSTGRPSSASTSAIWTDHGARQAFEETIRDLASMYDVALGGSDRRARSRIRSTRRRRTPPRSARGRRSPCSIIARTSRACWPSAARSIAACSASRSTAPATATTARSGAASCSSAASRDGFERVAHLRQAPLPGGDAAARHPVQAAAGFLADIDVAVDLTQPPFGFPRRYRRRARRR